MSTTAELHHLARDHQYRTAHAYREADGAVVVEGCDVGPQIRQWYGPETRRYEWGVRVPADQIPALMAVLDRSGRDPIDAIADWFTDETGAFEPFLDAHGVVHESWSRVDL